MRNGTDHERLAKPLNGLIAYRKMRNGFYLHLLTLEGERAEGYDCHKDKRKKQ